MSMFKSRAAMMTVRALCLAGLCVTTLSACTPGDTKPTPMPTLTPTPTPTPVPTPVPTPTPPAEAIVLTLTPTQVELAPGATQVFQATVNRGGVRWRATAGTLSATGLTATYTAPVTPGAYSVQVVSDQDASEVEGASVTVKAITPPPPATLIEPFTLEQNCLTDATSSSGSRKNCLSPLGTFVAATGYFIAEQATQVKMTEKNGSENNCYVIYADYVELLPGVNMPRKVTLQAQARSPRGYSSGRGWTTCKLDGKQIKPGA